MTIDETNPHCKFAKYWESIGRPQMEVTQPYLNGWGLVAGNPIWDESNYYRIEGDRHWELRREWVDSDFTMPLEFKDNGGKWRKFNSGHFSLQWFQEFEYRKAETQQEQIMTKTRELPVIVEGKKLMPVDVPISTLREQLAALGAGYVLEDYYNEFCYITDSSFVFVSKITGAKTTSDEFFEFLANNVIAAYQLVDAPWWDNIPEGGVLCKNIKGNWYGVVSGYRFNETGKVVIAGGLYPLDQFEPVTDDWLESMKRGF